MRAPFMCSNRVEQARMTFQRQTSSSFGVFVSEKLNCLITLTPVAIDIKLISFPLTLWQNKLECLPPCKYFSALSCEYGQSLHTWSTFQCPQMLDQAGKVGKKQTLQLIQLLLSVKCSITLTPSVNIAEQFCSIDVTTK